MAKSEWYAHEGCALYVAKRDSFFPIGAHPTLAYPHAFGGQIFWSVPPDIHTSLESPGEGDQDTILEITQIHVVEEKLSVEF